MSSPLDRTLALVALLRALLREFHKECEGCPVEDLCDQAEALVNVAKAAEGVMTQMDYETPHHTRLREALAALDKEPA